MTVAATESVDRTKDNGMILGIIDNGRSDIPWTNLYTLDFLVIDWI